MDITDYVAFGEENRITVNVNTGVQPSSRWYTGSGLFRGLVLCHSPRVHIQNDGVFVYTKEVTGENAFLEAQVDLSNATLENRLVKVTVMLMEEGSTEIKAKAERVVQINPNRSHCSPVESDPVLLWLLPAESPAYIHCLNRPVPGSHYP